MTVLDNMNFQSKLGNKMDDGSDRGVDGKLKKHYFDLEC